MIQIEQRKQKILDFIGQKGQTSNREILVFLTDSKENISRITLTRDLDELIKGKLIKRIGKGRSVRYTLYTIHPLLLPVDAEAYFKISPDERKNARKSFDFSIFEKINNIFSTEEFSMLETLAENFKKRLLKFSPIAVRKEFERLTIELSWKSSEIEGNTYTLLDTERLLKDHYEALGHKKEEAIMLLNHKNAIEYTLSKPEHFKKVSRAKIEEIHELLIKDLEVSRGLRKRAVGIVGTAFHPIDNVFQIEEAIEKLCFKINESDNSIEKAFFILSILPYIQPFEDGNKRTSRILSDALLWAYGYCPLSFRSINELEYKKAIILVYEQHNFSLIKKLFIEQFIFACENYFK